MKNIFQLLVISGLAILPSILTAQSKKSTSISDTLPAPYATKSAHKFSKVIGWKEGQTPIAPAGFNVTAFSRGLDNPRWTYVLPTGDILVAESNSNHSFLERLGAPLIGADRSNNLHKSANRITLLRDTDHDGVAEVSMPFLTDLNQPFGMLVLGEWFYVANTDGVYRYRYSKGQTHITGTGEKIMTLPGGKRHWARNIIANAEGTKIYVAVGSGTNVAEDGISEEILRADIIEADPDGKNFKIYASGLRNPCGMDWSSDGKLWTVVNERDELGDDLVPDYLTHVERDGFYGWPYVYMGTHIDPRVKEKNEVLSKHSLVPDFPLGAHTASLGLAFYTANAFPEKYYNGVFIGQHGSWNRSTLSGYKVIFIPFKNGKPSGPQEDFLTGFISNLSDRKVHGRPVGVTLLPDGGLLVADDVSKVIWKVSRKR